MSEFTTIQITKDLKQKLDLNKGENNNTYNIIIEKLLEQSGGVIADDVAEIQREQTAIPLIYYDDDGQNVLNVSFLDLIGADIGATWVANENPAGNFVNTKAEVIWKHTGEVIVRIIEARRNNGNVYYNTYIKHIYLF